MCVCVYVGVYVFQKAPFPNSLLLCLGSGNKEESKRGSEMEEKKNQADRKGALGETATHPHCIS